MKFKVTKTLTGDIIGTGGETLARFKELFPVGTVFTAYLEVDKRIDYLEITNKNIIVDVGDFEDRWAIFTLDHHHRTSPWNCLEIVEL